MCRQVGDACIWQVGWRSSPCRSDLKRCNCSAVCRPMGVSVRTSEEARCVNVPSSWRRLHLASWLAKQSMSLRSETLQLFRRLPAYGRIGQNFRGSQMCECAVKLETLAFGKLVGEAVHVAPI